MTDLEMNIVMASWGAVYSPETPETPEPLKNMSSTYVGKIKLTWIIKLHQMIPLQLLYTL